MITEDSITIEAAATPPDSSLAPARLLELLLTPATYFASRSFLHDQRAAMIAAYLVGVSSAIDRIDQKMIQADIKATGGAQYIVAVIADSWISYWAMVLISGLLSAKILWHLGGWWYKKRLQWSGAEFAEPHDARRVYVFNQLVYTGPAALLAIIQTALYQNYNAAWHSDDMSGMVIVALLFWSCWTSYCGATTVFPVTKAKARIWFLILPIALYIAALGLLTALIALLGK
jgi:hypothetical protein